MIGFLGTLMQSLRPFIVLGIVLGFVAVYYTNGSVGLWIVLKLFAIGVVMNFAIWLAVRRLWRKAEVADKDHTSEQTGEPH